MAVLVTNSNSGGAGAASSITVSMTPSGSDRGLIAAICFYQNTDTFVNTVTFNGVGLTAVPSSLINNGSYYVVLYYLIAPAAVTANLVVNFGGSSPFDAGLTGVAVSGAHQTTPLGTAVTASGTSTGPSVTPASVTDALVVDGLVIVHNATLTVGTGQTQRSNATAAGFIKRACSTEPGAASVPMTWTNGASAAWAQCAVSINPVGGGPPTPSTQRFHSFSRGFARGFSQGMR